jgi:hypothetical protein
LAEDVRDDISSLHNIRISPRSCQNKWYPEETLNDPEGMYVLQRLPPPDRSFVPQGFISGSRNEFVSTLSKITETFGSSQPEVVTVWNEFAVNVPLNDNVQDYIRQKPEQFIIPFKEILFSGVDVDNTAQIAEFISKKRNARPEIPKMRSNDSITWSRRGKKPQPNDPNHNKLRVPVDAPATSYVNKSTKRNRNSALALMEEGDEVPNQKTKRVKKISRPSSDDDDDSDHFSEHSDDDGDASRSQTIDQQENEECDDNDDDDEEDEYGVDYITDDEKVDANSFYFKRTKVEVKGFGSSLIFINRIFSVTNLSKGSELFRSALGTIVKAKVYGVACKKDDDDDNHQLYFKIYEYDHQQSSVSDLYKENDSCRYVLCQELMSQTNAKAIKWEGGNPASLGQSLIGTQVRRPFKIDKVWRWFNGTVKSYLKSKKYCVLYEDGDEVDESEKDVVKYLVYTLPF